MTGKEKKIGTRKKGENRINERKQKQRLTVIFLREERNKKRRNDRSKRWVEKKKTSGRQGKSCMGDSFSDSERQESTAPPERPRRNEGNGTQNTVT